MLTRLAIHRLASVDLAVQENNGTSYTWKGVFLRRHNDIVNLELLPGLTLPMESLQASVEHRLVQEQSSAKDISFNEEAAILHAAHPSGARMDLIIPVAHSNPFPLFWCAFQPSSGKAAPLLKISKVSALVMLTKEDDIDHPQKIEVGEETVLLVLRDGDTIGVTAWGLAAEYVIMITRISQTETESLLELKKNGQVLTITPSAPLQSRLLLNVTFFPTTHGRGITNSPGGSGSAVSELLILLEQGFDIALLAWLSCLPAGFRDQPIAVPCIGHPLLSFPTVGFLDNSDPKNLKIWGVPSSELVRCTRVILIGHIKRSELERVLALSPFAKAGVIETAEQRGGARMVPRHSRSFRALANAKPGRIVDGVVANTPVIGLWCRDPIKIREVIEEFFHRVVFEENAKAQIPNWDARLPELPLYGDSGFAVLSMLGNAYRGRLGVTQCRSFDDYGAKNLWMLPYPWDEVAGDRSRALSELAVRIVTEFEACRALALLSWTLPSDVAAHLDHSFREDQTFPDQDLCISVLELWMLGQARDETQTETMKRDFASLMAQAGMQTVPVLLSFAKTLYVLAGPGGDFVQRNVRKNEVALARNLVLFIVDYSQDANLLNLESMYWVLYTARGESGKPNVIFPAVARLGLLHELRMAIRDLRLALYTDEFEELELDITERICLEITKLLGSCLDPAVIYVIYRVGVFRVVSFSDIPMDLLPFDTTVLGLERPMLRLPKGGSIPETINATVLNTLETSKLGRSVQCAILCAPPEDTKDPAVTWAGAVGESLEKLFKFTFGSPVVFPVSSTATCDSILDVAAQSTIVVFIGHASASEHWAGLDVGGGLTISAKDVEERDWFGVFVFLIGCETAASETSGGDIASAFASRGARAVIGTSTIIRVDFAEFFMGQFINYLVEAQFSAETAFFVARRKTVVYEILRRQNTASKGGELLEWMEEAVREFEWYSTRMEDILQKVNIDPGMVWRYAPQSLGITLVGGISQRLV